MVALAEQSSADSTFNLSLATKQRMKDLERLYHKNEKESRECYDGIIHGMFSETPSSQSEIGSSVYDFVHWALMVQQAQRAEVLQRFISPDGEWDFSAMGLSLPMLMTAPIEVIGNIIRLELGPVQDLANVWPIAENALMNDHSSQHIQIASENLEKLLAIDLKMSVGPLTRKEVLERRMVRIALWLHDIGIAISGKENHQLMSVQFAREAIEGWNPGNSICQRIEYLIRHHVSSEVNLSQLRHDKYLAMLVMADEIHLEDRLLPVHTQNLDIETYMSDPWIRIARHVRASGISLKQFKKQKYMVWHIRTKKDEGLIQDILAQQLQNDGAPDQFIQETLQKTNILESLNRAIFSKKYAMLQACADGLYQQEGEKPVGVLLELNGTLYEVGKHGVIIA